MNKLIVLIILTIILSGCAPMTEDDINYYTYNNVTCNYAVAGLNCGISLKGCSDNNEYICVHGVKVTRRIGN